MDFEIAFNHVQNELCICPPSLFRTFFFKKKVKFKSISHGKSIIRGKTAIREDLRLLPTLHHEWWKHSGGSIVVP